MNRPSDEQTPLTPEEVAERLFDHWNDRQEDDSNNEGVEDDDRDDVSDGS